VNIFATTKHIVKKICFLALFVVPLYP
jgi:hypothetical protein